MIVVIKIGGSLLAKNFENVINDIANIYNNYSEKYTLIVVHGGGPQINETLKKMGKEPKYYKTPSGFTTRYTDQESIEAAIMSLGGLNNKRLVEALQKQKVNAFGFSGVDGGVIEAERKDKILVLIEGKRIIKRDEYSGKVSSISTPIIQFLTQNKYLPVIACLAKSKMGEIVNVDGDRAASFIASALNADILISLTDVEGIYKDFKDKGSIIKQINSNELEKLTDKLEGGMKKKTYAAMEAMKIGIRKVIICSGLSQNPILDALEKNAGTVISIE